MSTSILPEDTIDDILYLARTADTSELLTLLSSLSESLSISPLAILGAAKDPYTGNTALHYAAANGHTDILLSLLALDDSAPTHILALTTQSNGAGNTALHYAALNGHLPTLKILLLALLPDFAPVTFQTSESGLLPESSTKNPDDAVRDGVKGLAEQRRKDLLGVLEAKNKAGRDAAGEAEGAGKDEVVGWLLGVMDRLEGGSGGEEDAEGGEGDNAGVEEGEVKISMGDTTGDDVAEEIEVMKVKD